MWPMSELGRRSGLIFIRRSTRDDPIYPAMMRLYFGHLLRQHANLEWYFEGGRTRTGKLRPPKMGVLRYLVDAFIGNGSDADDVALVPVAIVYDQQAEVAALSFEESGGAKTPESLAWLVRFARAQSPRPRPRPRPLRSAACPCGRRSRRRPSAPGPPTPPRSCPRVAFEVAHRINAATPITPSALVTFGLLDNDGRAMTLAETLGVLEPLLVYVRRRQLPLTSDVDLGRPEGMRRALRDAGPGGRRRGVRRRAGAGLRDRPRAAARGGVLPQHGDPLLHHPGDRRGRRGPGADLGRRGRRRRRPHHHPVGARAGPPRPAQVRVLLRHQGRVRRRDLRYETVLALPGWDSDRVSAARDHRAACRSHRCCSPTG